MIDALTTTFTGANQLLEDTKMVNEKIDRETTNNYYCSHKTAKSSCTSSLPFITDELFDQFIETSLMAWDKELNRPTWTQDAVDFACCLKIECKTHELEAGDEPESPPLMSFIMWRNVDNAPLCEYDDEEIKGGFDILFDDFFLAEILIKSSKHSSDRPGEKRNEYYIVKIREGDGMLEDMSGQDMGMDWESVDQWIPLDELKAI